MNPLFLLYRGAVFCGMKDRREKNTDGKNQYQKMLLLMLLRILWKHADEEHIQLNRLIITLCEEKNDLKPYIY